mgnify:CR=1 FL=1|tara:strand:+ start:382 stop:618 length:237 start_codon:yes stop_codon:yes gene_type:complete
MEKVFIRLTILVSAISSLSCLGFIFVKIYNAPENIEKRCLVEFQKDAIIGSDKSDVEWGKNIDLAEDKFFKCISINIT